MNPNARKQNKEVYVERIAICALNVGIKRAAVTGMGRAAVTTEETVIYRLKKCANVCTRRGSSGSMSLGIVHHPFFLARSHKRQRDKAASLSICFA